MQEVEAKILDVTVEEIEKKLTEAGAIFVGEFFIRDQNFDFADERITEKKELCRLRSRGDVHELTYKSGRTKVGNIRSAEEVQITVSSLEETETILQHLGLSSVRIREKNRKTYTLDGAQIEIDSCPHIPPYVEIEGTNEQIKSIALLLGYTTDDLTDKTNSEVYEHYRVDRSQQVF